jgi:glycosyltransferase involved in cell wall biosynthesis
VDTVDVHFLRERRQAELAKDADGLQKAGLTRGRELKIYDQADLVVTVTQADAEVLREAGLGSPTAVVPTIHLLIGETPGWEARRDLVFVGNFNHTPNIDAALWFCREILPKVQALRSDIQLSIIGPNPPPEVQALTSPSVSVLGWVPDTAPHLDAARISVAPLRAGAGMKGKVGEALSRGIPVVTTTIGAEGMDLQHGQTAMVADDANRFAEAIVRLYEDQVFWEAMAQAGREVVHKRYSLESVGVLLQDLLTSSARPK